MNPDSPSPIGTGTRIGPYEIVGWLGAGGMGDVYRARDERLGREVALKLIGGASAADPSRVHRFEQEARAAGQSYDLATGKQTRLTRLSNPATISTFDISPDGRRIVFDRVRERGDIVLIDRRVR